MTEEERQEEMESIARDMELMGDDIGIMAWNGAIADEAYTLNDLKRFQNRMVNLIRDMDNVFEQRMAAKRE